SPRQVTIPTENSENVILQTIKDLKTELRADMLNLASRNEATYSAHSQLAALSTAVAPIAVTPNTPVPPRIRLEADETLGTMVHCGRCGRFRHGLNECHWASNNCSRCNTYGHSIWECGIPSDARRPPNQYDNGPRGSFNNRDRNGTRRETPIPTDRLLRTRLKWPLIARLPLIPTRNLPLLAATIAVLSVARKDIGGLTVQPTLSLLKPSLSSNNAPLMVQHSEPQGTLYWPREVASTRSNLPTRLPNSFTLPLANTPSDINYLEHQLLPDSSAPLTNPLNKKQSPYVLGRNIARDHPLHEAKAPTDDMSPALQITHNKFTARRHHPDERAPDNIKNPASSSPSVHPSDRALTLAAIETSTDTPTLGRERE
ncbi:unnamed protein product, partial [Aphanomyces euteiches]